MVIAIQCHEGPREVEAVVFGEWAAHRGVHWDADSEPDEQWWVVTHVPSGRCIRPSTVGQLSDVRAVEIARMLGERVPAGIIPPISPDPSTDPHGVPGYEQALRVVRSVLFDVLGALP